MAKEHRGPDLKAVLSTIKSRYSSKKSSFEWFVRNSSRLNIMNIDERSLKLDLRGEKTPSTAVSEYLTFTDFGDDGRKHDVIYLIQKFMEIISKKQLKDSQIGKTSLLRRILMNSRLLSLQKKSKDLRTKRNFFL